MINSVEEICEIDKESDPGTNNKVINTTQESKEFETLIIHAHAPFSEENTPKKKHKCKSNISNLNVKEQIKHIHEKKKDVYEVKIVLVTQLGYNTYRPTTLEIIIRKSETENFKDIGKFIKKIGLHHFPDLTLAEYLEIKIKMTHR